MEPDAKILDLERQIYSYAQVRRQPVDEYYVETTRQTCDGSYCRECVAAVFVTEQCRLLGDDKAEVWLGMSCGTENDHCMRCDTCGRLLSYSLTDYGARDELGHFSRTRFPRKPLPADTAYEISAMLSGIAYSGEPDEVAAAIRVGRRAVNRMNLSLLST